ncbi:MAG: DUF6048 family protein [Flavipsychrobacter sp.]
MLKYSFSILLMLMVGAVFAQDSTSANVPDGKTISNQLRINLEISKPFTTLFQDRYTNYEMEVDYYWKKEGYLSLEGGYGTATVDYTDLKYNSTNTFVKVGYNKSMLSRIMPKDWDMAFIGVRYAVGFINRGDANYLIVDSTWGNTPGVVAGKTLTAHWAEVVGGVKVEVYKGFFLGWTARGKFLLNQKQFKELPPSYMAGYGKGDKNTIFDFNFYFSYAIRWDKKKATK